MARVVTGGERRNGSHKFSIMATFFFLLQREHRHLMRLSCEGHNKLTVLKYQYYSVGSEISRDIFGFFLELFWLRLLAFVHYCHDPDYTKYTAVVFDKDSTLWSPLRIKRAPLCHLLIL